MKKKFGSVLLALTLAFSVFAGCGETQSSTVTETQTEVQASESAAASESTEAAEAAEAVAESATESTADDAAAASELLLNLTGSYKELWPVILADEYKDVWLTDCAAIVGEDNAKAAFDKLSSMVTGEVYGEDAVTAYQDGNFAYFCGFTEGLATLEFDGATSTIKGQDADGNELFAHTYHFIGMEETRGLYEFESDDADSGEFTYFFLAPDTSDTTYHIEFRYGSDAEALAQYDAGPYAYWLASGIATDCDSTMIENDIELFCNENLAQ